MIGISGCLGGAICRYDGKLAGIPELETMVQNGQAIMVCPEVLGGLSTPRDPAEIIGGDGIDVWRGTAKVMTVNGQDVTESFKQGAILAFEQITEREITRLILKERSPSCGSHMIYDGSFSGNKQEGLGVATAYFIAQGLKIFSEADWRTAIEFEVS